MLPYNCQSGQSFLDVCLNTYGTLNKFTQLLNDNGLAPDDIPYSGQVVYWGEETATEIPSASVSLTPAPYSTSPFASTSSSSQTMKGLKFLTTAGKTSYTIADVPELALISGKKILLATMDSTILTTLFNVLCSWNNSQFEIIGIPVAGDEEITILAL